MALEAKTRGLPASSAADPALDPVIGDFRFRALLSEDDWARLPRATRRRFSKRLAGGESTVYVGEVEVSFSRIGWWLAQIARLLGGPLPTSRDTGVPGIVTVTEDVATGGQIWTRIYARRNGFPQVVHSSKRFEGSTGLEEYLGFGIGMALRTRVEGEALLFCSAGYVLHLGPLRLRLPALLTPGDLTVSHSDFGGEFRFTLELVHPRFGMLVRQSGIFKEATS
ncbi:MAG TPA: DUF4166 domain-containing protein [Bradyrhizobium sp.]|nr:DUF4166 domain-containing protein [Bradyrhizobium sp.]